MRGVWRIERAAEQSDTHAGRVARQNRMAAPAAPVCLPA